MNNLLENYNSEINAKTIIFHPIFNNRNEEVLPIKAPYGMYNVEVSKMEIQETSQGEPMFSIWFKVMDGVFENSMIVYNRLLIRGFWIYEVCELIRSFETGLEVSFKEFEQFSLLTKQVMEVLQKEQKKLVLHYYNEEENDKCEII